MKYPTLAIRSVPRGLVVRWIDLFRLGLVGLFLGNLGRIPAFSTGERDTAILLNDVLVAIILLAGLLRMTALRSLRLDKVAGLALLFAVVGASSTLYSMSRFSLSGFEVAVSLAYLARWLYYFAVYVVMINVLRAEDVESLWRALEIVILAFALFGVIQALMLPDFAQLVYPNARVGTDWDAQGNRLVSTWLDPVLAGAFIVVGLLMQVGEIAVGRRVASWKPLILTIALLLTVSRASVLAALVGLFAVVVIRGVSARLFASVTGVVILIVAGSPLVVRFTDLSVKYGVDVSGMVRVIAWFRGLRVFLDHPIVGIGFNAWGFVQERYGYARTHAFSYALDGGLIFIAVMTGLLGLTIYVWMLITVIRRARKVWRDATMPPQSRAKAIAIAAAIPATVVHSLFANSLLLPFLMETTWILWAILFVIATRADAQSHGDVLNVDRSLPKRISDPILK